MSARSMESCKNQNKSQDFAAYHLFTTANVNARLGQRYEQLLHSEKYSDCVFLVGTTTLKAHKLILSAASPVFEAMFYGPMHEQNHVIKILDMSAEMFYALLSAIYAGFIDFAQLSLDDAIELCYGAEKYLLTELANDCRLAIKDKLRFSNILPTLELCVCMNMQGLLEVCLNFFLRCCIRDPQYVAYFKQNYVHVSKECIKVIIATDQELRHLLWFVAEWCEHECAALSAAEQRDGKLHRNDAAEQLQNELLHGHTVVGTAINASHTIPAKSLARSHFKACSPFKVSAVAHEWHSSIISNRFISLSGIIICSRLMPSTVLPSTHPTEYNENLQIEIRSKKISSSLSTEAWHDDNYQQYYEAQHEETPVVLHHVMQRHPTKYNCDLNIQWKEIILSPEFEYQIKLKWPSAAYGAEYPCSLLSTEVDGVLFKDLTAHCGSLVKGLNFSNLL